MTRYFVIGCYLTAMSAFLSGALVSLGGLRHRLNRVYTIFSGLLMMWSAALGSALIVEQPATSLLLFRIEHAAVVFIPTLYLHVVTALIDHESRTKKVLLLFYGFSSFLFILNASGLLITGVRNTPYFHYYKQPGDAYPLLMLMFAVSLGYAFFLLFRTFSNLAGHQKNRLVFFLIASIFGFAGGLPTFLPLYNIYPWPFVMYITPVFYFIIAYAIVKHRLMDISLTVGKGASYALTLIFVVVPMLIAFYFIQKTLEVRIAAALALLVTFGIIILIQKIHPLSIRFIQTRFLKKHTDHFQTLRKFSNDMFTATDLKLLRDRLEKTLREAMQVKSVALYLVRPRRSVRIAGVLSPSMASKAGGGAVAYSDEIIPLWTASEALVNVAYAAKDVLVLGEMELMARGKADKALDEAIIQMQTAHAEVCVPFKRDNKMLGFALLGPREGNRYYSPEDLDLLHILGQNTCVAVQNALLVDEIKRSYKTLHRSQRLAAMEPILEGLSPRIRSPLLTSTLALDLFEDPVRNAERIQRQRIPIRTAVKKITTVLDDVSVLTGPYTAQFAAGSVNAIMDEVIEELGPQIQEKRVDVQRAYGAPSGTMIDAARLKQAFFDLLLNAVEASRVLGAVRVSTRTVQLMQEGFLAPLAGVQVEVADEGCGIAPENQERVFDPFFTTKHKSAARAAAGLGLSIAHRIVEEHRGNIELKSEPGRGTTITVTLPAEQT